MRLGWTVGGVRALGVDRSYYAGVTLFKICFVHAFGVDRSYYTDIIHLKNHIVHAFGVKSEVGSARIECKGGVNFLKRQDNSLIQVEEKKHFVSKK